MSAAATGLDAARRAVHRLGLEEPVRRARALADPGLRRDMQDHRALRLLFAIALEPDSDTIDVGAHRGDVLASLVRLAPEGRHIAYEPIPELHAALAKSFPGVDVRRAALSDAASESSFAHVVSAPGLSGLRKRDYPGRQTTRQLTVRTERLDDALPDGFAPALIKVDVEGAELAVLRGAERTLAACRPVVVFEHGAGAAEFYEGDSGDLHDLLAGHAGLRIFDLAGSGPFSRTEFVDLFHKPIWNFVACR